MTLGVQALRAACAIAAAIAVASTFPIDARVVVHPDTLELTNLKVPPPPDEFGPQLGAYSHAPRETLPLALSLRLDAERYTSGQTITAQVEATNSGTQPVQLPWEPDWRQIPLVPNGRIVSFWLVFYVRDERDEHFATFSGPHVYGSLAFPPSIKTVMPGATVAINLTLDPSDGSVNGFTFDVRDQLATPRLLGAHVKMLFTRRERPEVSISPAVSPVVPVTFANQ